MYVRESHEACVYHMYMYTQEDPGIESHITHMIPILNNYIHVPVSQRVTAHKVLYTCTTLCINLGCTNFEIDSASPPRKSD